MLTGDRTLINGVKADSAFTDGKRKRRCDYIDAERR